MANYPANKLPRRVRRENPLLTWLAGWRTLVSANAATCRIFIPDYRFSRKLILLPTEVNWLARLTWLFFALFHLRRWQMYRCEYIHWNYFRRVFYFFFKRDCSLKSVSRFRAFRLKAVTLLSLFLIQMFPFRSFAWT